MRHLISTRRRLVVCKVCREKIFFGYDGGMPVYVNTEPVTALEEIACRLQGHMTFVLQGGYLTARNTFNIHVNAPVFVPHEHRNGFDECPTPISKRETGSNVPPF
jgi:hypothetical protein